MAGERTASDTVVGVAMSGGVDSSVAAALLLERGYDVVGLTMHLWTDPHGQEMALNRASGCCSAGIARDAASVAARLGFRHYVLDLSREFHEWVVRDFAGEYLAGRTPNPCVRCNTLVKWRFLLDRAQRLGCTALATGHYARIERGTDRTLLRRASFREKDQSYALWGLSQGALEQTMLPLGELSKPEVRRLAARLGLQTAERPDSQEICFVPDDDYRRFLRDNFASAAPAMQPGEIVGRDGRVLGMHEGVAFYTLGQRKGLRLTSARPLYVTRIDVAANCVYVGHDEDCGSRVADVEQVNWVSMAEPAGPIRCQVQVRYRDSAREAQVTPLGANRAHIEFDEPVRAVTPGQSAVFYDDDLVLGGGVLGSTEAADHS